MIKQLKMREYSVHFVFPLNCYVLVVFNSTVPSSLTSCIQNVVDIFRDAVDRRHKQHVIVTQMFQRLYIQIAWESRTGLKEYFHRGNKSS